MTINLYDTINTMTAKKLKTVMVFGVFDGVHDGHLYFFDEAKKHGNRLIAVVTRDQAAFRLKNRPPKMGLEKRLEEVAKCKAVSEAIAGDNTEGIWEVAWKYKPDIIAVGYDQEKLHHALLRDKENFSWPVEIVTIKPHEPDKFHSSILSK